MAMQMGVAVAVALLAASVLASGAAAQSQNPPTCASKLVPCAPYMNGTVPPPDTCCGPIKEAVKNELPCLCALYAAPEIFKAFNINITQALGLSKRCGVSDTLSACPAGNSTTKSPPGSSSGGASGSGSNAGHHTLFVSVPGLMSLFLALWSLLA